MLSSGAAGGGCLRIVYCGEVEADEVKEAAEKTRVRWLITKEMGAKNFAMRMFELEPGGHTPLHHQPWEHEVFVLEGEGVVFDGEAEHKFGEWDVIFIPPNETHQFRNTGDRLLRILCLIPYRE